MATSKKKPKKSSTVKKPAPLKPWSDKSCSAGDGMKTHIAIVLDASGSMAHLRRQALEFMNSQLVTIANNTRGVQTDVMALAFNTEMYDIFPRTDARDVRPVAENRYNPAGGTALYDAVGQQIDRFLALEDAKDPDTSFLMVIITDGEENASRHYTGPMLAGKIDALQSSGRWTFSYMGANQDLSKIVKALGLNVQNTVMWTASADGFVEAANKNSYATSNYLASRSAGNKAMANFYDPNPVGATVTTTTTIKETPKKP